jgi:DNA primase
VFIPDVDIKEFLTDKGIEFKDAGDWVHMRCLFPDHDDEDPSFSIDTEALAYNCYGCKRSGTWSHLCKEMGWAVNIQPIIGEIKKTLWNDIQRSITSMLTTVPEVNHIRFHLPMNFRPLSLDSKQWEYLAERGMPIDAIEEFGFGYSPAGSAKSIDPDYKKMFWGRVVIPVHDENGEYVWPEGRAVFDVKPKYWRPKGVQKELFFRL